MQGLASSREAGRRGEIGQRETDEVGHEEKETAALGRELAFLKREPTDIGHRLDRGAGVLGALLVEASRQRGKAFLAQDVARGRGGHLLTALGEGPADVMDRVVLLAQGDDLLAHGIVVPHARGSADGGGLEELARMGIMAETGAEHAEGAWRVAEGAGRLLRRDPRRRRREGPRTGGGAENGSRKKEAGFVSVLLSPIAIHARYYMDSKGKKFSRQ